MSSNFIKSLCLTLAFSSLVNFLFALPIFPSSDVYNEIIKGLTDHIKGTKTLTSADFISNHDLLVQNMAVLATDKESVSNSFALIALFEDTNGALFTTANTRNGFNRPYANDGLNLHRNIFLIHQGLIDYSFNEQWLKSDLSLLDGKYFKTTQYFPGFVDPPATADIVENAKIKFSYMLANGSQPWSNIGNPNTIRPTGCYLAPGSIGEITVPQVLVGKGIKIRVGAHFWDLKSKNSIKRIDRVSITFDINETVTKIANPLGGGIYIEVPLGVDEGILDVVLKNVVRSPFYSKKSFHETSISDWQNIERKHTAPWADFETDKFMMQVPTSWIYEFEDPKTLMEDWDKSMDAVSDLLGRPRITDRHKNYLQFDVIIRGSAYHPGYPMSNTPYNPNSTTNGMPNHNILRGPQYQQDIHFHELGHEVAISKFVGETEALVNFLYVPVLNKKFGYSLDEAFQQSFGPSYNYTSTKENTIKTRLFSDTFIKGERRNTCNCNNNEVRYQHRGYAHYVDIVDIFGWDALEKFWKDESNAADTGNPYPVNDQAQDDRIFRMSKAAGVDLRPLFHFWGIIPDNQNALAQRMKENDLKLPMSIKQKLHKYRALIPANYDEFVMTANELAPNFLNYSGIEFGYGAGWFKMTSATYDETKAAKIEQELSDIIIYYYGTDCFELDEFVTNEFNMPIAYCKSNEIKTLPLTTANGISGSWSAENIDASLAGSYEHLFVPNLSECSTDSSVVIEIYETKTDIIGEKNICDGSSTILYTDVLYKTYSWMMDGVHLGEDDSISILKGGLLSLVLTDTNECIIEGELLINQFDPISIAVDVSNPLCFGDYGSALFTTVGGSGSIYTYSINSDSLLAGMYNVVVSDSFGCNATIEIEVSQPEPISIEMIDKQVAVNGGVQPYTITIDTMGNLQTFLVMDANGCESSAAFTLSSITNDSFDKLLIFPNPTTSHFNIDLSGLNSKIKSLDLLSINGQQILNYSQEDSIFDISKLENGVYILQIVFENDLKMFEKVIKVKN